MSKRLNRIRDRKLLVATGLLYLIRGSTLLAADPGHALLVSTGTFILFPATFWGVGFLLIGALALVAAPVFGYHRGRQALGVAAAWALGYATFYLTMLILGNWAALPALTMWVYVGVVTSISSRQVDPNLLGKVAREVTKAGKEK